MKVTRLVEGLRQIGLWVFAVSAIVLASSIGRASDNRFPVDQEWLLDTVPMLPGKRMPSLTVGANGSAAIGLWCKDVTGRVELGPEAIRIEPGALPDRLPQWMSAGQCTPARMQADEDVLAALSQVTTWRRQGQILVLLGPTTLKFRPSDH
ncbi:MAG TPA: META domain-containing protein [Pseudolabrys sp.]|nr:META domain-containing protein [Pseudolabrys sp.]